MAAIKTGTNQYEVEMIIYMMQNIKTGALIGPAFTTRQIALDSWKLTNSKTKDLLDEYKVTGVPILDYVEHM